MKKLEKILKALASSRRLAILSLLKMKGELNVGAIALEIGLSLKATSRHLCILNGAGILKREQRGLEVYYRIVDVPDLVVRDVLSRI